MVTRSYFRPRRNTSEPDPLMDVIGFSGNNRTSDEVFVRNIRQTIGRSIMASEKDIEAAKEILGGTADIKFNSVALEKDSAKAALSQVANARNGRAIQKAIILLGLPSLQELHLMDFDPAVDGEYLYQATEDSMEYHVVSRRAWFGKEGRPARPSNGTPFRVFIGVGDDPMNRGRNRSGPTPAQIRHQAWRKLVNAEGLGLAACVIHTMRVVGVSHELSSEGDRQSTQTVFYVEAYSGWTDGYSKMLVSAPTMDGNGTQDDAGYDETPDTVLASDFGDEDSFE